MHFTNPQALNQEAGIIDAIFFSPHLDDAVLSSGNQIATYVRAHKKVVVVTIFSQGNDKLTSISACTFLKQSGVNQASVLFRRRKKEDINALRALGVSYVLHLDYTDGLFRQSKQIGRVYPIYPSFSELFSGCISPKDHGVIRQISHTLTKIRRQFVRAHTHIYAPLGVGNHMDHIITHQTVSRAFPHAIYWEDVPYRSNSETLYSRLAFLGHSKPLHHKIIDTPCFQIKKRAISYYKSQLSGLYQNGLGDIDYIHEVLYAYI
jgi:LmbE family N-acetylglucosaminyl deacetylase